MNTKAASIQMNTKTNFYTETKIIITLAIPLIASGLVEAAVGFFSTLFLAHLGPQELAAGALVNWLFVTLLVLMWGLLTAVSVMVAQRYGAGDTKGIATVLLDSVLFCIVLTIPTFVLIWNADTVLLYFGQKPTTVLLAKDYLRALAFGIFPDFIFLVLQQFLIGLGHVRANMFFTFIWVPINIAANYILMFGKWGIPSLGMAGIGWGTSFSFWFMSFLITAYLLSQKDYKKYLPFKKHLKLFSTWGELLKVGVPMGAMFTVEIAFFFTLSLVMGNIGIADLAANQIVMQYVALFGMLIFCTAQAITVRVGHSLGAGDATSVSLANYSGILVSVLFTILVGACYWFIPNILIDLDLDPTLTKNHEIISLAKQFFVVAAIFELLEAIRFSYFGSLRGLSDTTFTLLVSIIMFWGVALPAGYFLSKWTVTPGLGYWWGLVIGAVFGILLLIWRFHVKLRTVFAKIPASSTRTFYG